MTRWLVVLLFVLAVRPAPARTIVLVGDSTSWGAVAGGQSWARSSRALRAILRSAPRGTPWRQARILDLSVPGTTTADWLERFPEAACVYLTPRWSPLLHRACERHVPLVEAMPEVAGKMDLVLVVLGTNDVGQGGDPRVVVNRLATLPARLAPATVRIAPPFPVAPPFDVAVARIRDELLARGLLTGPDWPPLPRWDAVHLTDGGYAAAAGLWLDTILAVPVGH